MPSNLRLHVNKLSDNGRSCLEAAAGLCLARTHYDVEVEHFLLKAAEAQQNDVGRILQHFEIDPGKFIGELNIVLDRVKKGNANTPAMSPRLLKMLTEAWTLASLEFGAPRLRTGFIILTLATNEELARL